MKDLDGQFSNLSYHTRISKQHKFFCMTVPKAACSKIKSSLHLLEGNTPPDPIWDIHDGGVRLTELSTLEVSDAFLSPAWFRFCFVSNPYFRLISAYKSKIINPNDTQYDYVRELISSKCNYPVSDGKPALKVAFHDFIKYVRDDPRAKRDAHWSTQTSLTKPENLNYDVIGKLENFERDFTIVLKRLNASQDLLDTVTVKLNSSEEITDEVALDTELADIVYKIYEDDFENFDYDRDSWLFDN